MSILYSNGKCSPDSSDGYNVDHDKVVRISARVLKPIRLSFFGFDLNKFRKGTIEDIVESVTYHNDNQGIRVYGNKTTLSELYIEPTKKQELLACEKQKK